MIFGVYFAISFKEFPEIIDASINKTQNYTGWSGLVSSIFQLLFLPSFCAIALKIYDQVKPDLKDIRPNFSAIWKLLVICLLVLFGSGIIFFIEFIFLILVMLVIKLDPNKLTATNIIAFSLLFIFVIAATYLYLRLKLFLFAIVDKFLDPLESLKHSWNISRGNILNLFVLLLVINIIPITISLLILFAAIAKYISIFQGQTLSVFSDILYACAFIISALTDAYIYRQLSLKEETQVYDK